MLSNFWKFLKEQILFWHRAGPCGAITTLLMLITTHPPRIKQVSTVTKPCPHWNTKGSEFKQLAHFKMKELVLVFALRFSLWNYILWCLSSILKVPLCFAKPLVNFALLTFQWLYLKGESGWQCCSGGANWSRSWKWHADKTTLAHNGKPFFDAF